MTKLKLNQVKISETPKAYKVEGGVLFIDDDPIELEMDNVNTATWNVPEGSEDFNSIELNDDGDIVIDINIHTDSATMNAFFSVVKKNGETTVIEDATFPYSTVDGQIVWEASLESMEGMSW